MNFHFVDQIIALDPGEKAVGLKHVTAADCYLNQSSSGKPMLLACIVGEALGQLCSWNIIKSTDCQLRSVGGIVNEVRMSGLAYLGDTIRLEITIDKWDDQAVYWSGMASVRGQVILQISNCIGPCLTMRDFNDIDEVRRHLAVIDRPGEYNAASAPETQLNTDQQVHYQLGLTSYDNIIYWERGKKVIAQKNISILAPYFADHFPKKPVFPISLLLQHKLHLAQPFIAELVGVDNAKQYFPNRVFNAKMRDFVLPGDTVLTTMALKEQTDKQFILAYHSEVNGRRVCVAQAEFTR